MNAKGLNMLAPTPHINGSTPGINAPTPYNNVRGADTNVSTPHTIVPTSDISALTLHTNVPTSGINAPTWGIDFLCSDKRVPLLYKHVLSLYIKKQEACLSIPYSNIN